MARQEELEDALFRAVCKQGNLGWFIEGYSMLTDTLAKTEVIMPSRFTIPAHCDDVWNRLHAEEYVDFCNVLQFGLLFRGHHVIYNRLLKENARFITRERMIQLTEYILQTGHPYLEAFLK